MAGSIYLFRHAEAGWGGQENGDKDRELSDVGRLSSKTMGQWFKSEGHTLDLILCSTAVRAQETMDGFLIATGLTPKIKMLDDLYLAPPEVILGALNEGFSGFKNIMVIGHNPGMHQLAFEFASHGQRKMDTELTTSYPPAGLTGFSVSIKGTALKKANLTYLFFKHPGKI